MNFKNLKKIDSSLYDLLFSEIKRQQDTINLIPSENIASEALLEVLGSPLTNKYSEGCPGARYYPGNFYYDEIEKLAQNRALKAFKLSSKNWSVNVQPYSGSPANLAIYAALLKPGDTIMGMSLSAGGHLTHGHKANFSSQLYKSVQYSVNPETGLIDYKQLEKLAKKYRPKIIISGATAYPRKIDFKKIGGIAKKIGAYHLADISHISGLVVAGLHSTPFPCSDVVMTTTHKTLRGPRGAVIFSRKNISEKIDKAVFPGMQGGPHNNVIAAIALTFSEAIKPSFKNYQKQVIKNNKALSNTLQSFGFKLMSNGTDNHLLLIDLKNLKIDGYAAEQKLEKAGIIANRNTVVGDKNPRRPSGLRLGTPFVTSRGMKEKEMKKIAELICRVLIKKENPLSIKKEVLILCKKFYKY
ncbi:MAG: serine hydroxymethyltransferase [Candidatus Paceibacterota bacterium]|jgi:glycine hydroxymethyltransferase